MGGGAASLMSLASAQNNPKDADFSLVFNPEISDYKWVEAIKPGAPRMAQMFNISNIAAAHNIAIEDLNTRIARQGWDFAKLDASDASAVRFVTDVVTGLAVEVQQLNATKARRTAAQTAEHQARLTVAARKHPEAVCYKCNGYGNIRGFDHIDGGKCFACSGAGVRRARRCA